MRKKFECKIATLFLWLLAIVFTIVSIPIIWGNQVWTLPIATLSLFNLPMNLAFRLDPLSTIVASMVLGIGSVVAQFSLRYLDGEKRQWYFYRYLVKMIIGVLLLTLSNNLLMLFAAWMLVSFCLHKLLLFYPERIEAHYGARKKWIVSRVGDLALLIGIVLVYMATGTFEFTEVFAAMNSGNLLSEEKSLVSIATVFFAVGAMTKSVQFPFHFWIAESLDTPAPVSAIMHAGVINAGGYLLLRLSPLMAQAQVANYLLILVGAFTASYAALVMITSNDIKRKLAFSTVSQMGMMIFGIGLGVYVIALFHIVAHSIYKSYYFLATGGIVQESRLKKEKIYVLSKFQRLLVFLSVSLLWGFALEYENGAYLSYATYLSVLGLGIIQNTPSTKVFRGGIFFYIRTGIVLTLAIIVLGLMESLLSDLTSVELAAKQMVQSSVLSAPLVSLGALVFFCMAFWISYELMEGQSKKSEKLYIKFWNDFYFSAKTTVFLKNVWPIKLNQSAKESVIA